MTRLLLSVICIFITVSITAETVYKKTKPDGSVEFSDKDSIDSETVKIRKPTTFSPPRLPSSRSSNKKTKAARPFTVTIIEPANDSTVVTHSEVKVTVSTSPTLPKRGFKFRYQLAGQTKFARSASVSFNNVVRGTHVVRVNIVDYEGKIVSDIASSTFHMKRFFKKPAPPKPKPKPKPKAP